MPTSNEDQVVPAHEFAVDRAMTPLLEMTKKPHYLGSENHAEVRRFLISELQKLGLDPHIQEGFNFNPQSKILTKPKNILARIPGSESGNALLLLSHYDSAAVASFGAADDASGVVTILESVRAFLSTRQPHKNDIIILFSDSEEISLDGAQLFVKEHPWVHDVSLVMNFEARGTGGPSNMILETNQGNAELIKAFVAANPKYPVASSLMYSVYKLLPNDTDSTIFREMADIDSFFFAFIDEHYNYHTANDTYYNLDRNSLAHQGSYLLPLLHYFADADLSTIKSNEDHVYFNFPIFKLIHYPFSWIYPLTIAACILFLLLVFYGSYKRSIKRRSVWSGFIPLFGSIITSGLFGFLGWKAILAFYPDYLEIQQGFTYNGYWYIAFFVSISLLISFIFYSRFTKKHDVTSLFVAPLFLWLLINILIAIYLKGAAFFIIPFLFGLISLFYMLKKKYVNPLVTAVLSIPSLFIFAPLIESFPVGLGLNMLLISCAFTALLFVLLLPVFGYYKKKKVLAVLSLAVAVFFFIKAHSQHGFSDSNPKPNSLIYYQNSDTKKAFWTTYDRSTDTWTEQFLGQNPESASKLIGSASYSKYGRNYTYAIETESKNIQKSEIVVKRDTVYANEREIVFTLIPKRRINKIELYAPPKFTFKELEFNDQKVSNTGETTYRGTDNLALLNYFISEEDSLHVKMKVNAADSVNLKIVEYSFDLMTNPEFQITNRTQAMMPKPFVLTDAIVVEHRFSFDSLQFKTSDSLTHKNKSLLNE